MQGILYALGWAALCATSLVAAPVGAMTLKCPPDSVKVGPTETQRMHPLLRLRGRGDFTRRKTQAERPNAEMKWRWGVGASRSERWRRYAASGTSCAQPSTCGGCGRWAGRRRSSVGACLGRALR
jgi:hypothetical protein